MKSQSVGILESVEPDLRQAREFHASWQASGADVFMEKFEEAASWIRENAELFPKKYRHFRRAPMRKSYYAVYYVIEPGVTVIVAVLDMRQNPKIIRATLGRRWIKK